MASTLRHGDVKLAHDVVMQLLSGLWNLEHDVVMDNFFSSIGLFMELLSKSTYATRTIRVNCVGLPMALKNTQAFKKEPQGTILWAMHNSRRVSCYMWKDKRLVLLISTHVPLVQAPVEIPMASVLRRDGAHRSLIPTSSQLVEYITWMRGVDVADQLRASYSCQVQSHIWWHHIFFFLLDLTVVNMYIIYLECCRTNGGSGRTVIPLTHL